MLGWEEPRYSLAPVKALISSALRREKKKNTTPAVNGNANLVLFQLAPTASCSAFLELCGGTGHDRSPPTGCQAICGAVNRLERGKNPAAFPPEASSTVTPPQTHEIAV